MYYRVIGKTTFSFAYLCLFWVKTKIWELGSKFITKCWYVQSGDGVKKPLLPFKEDQGDTYEWYNGKISISFFQLEKFSTLFIFTLFSVDLWSTWQCRLTVGNVSVACWPTVDWHPSVGAIVHYCQSFQRLPKISKDNRRFPRKNWWCFDYTVTHLSTF